LALPGLLVQSACGCLASSQRDCALDGAMATAYPDLDGRSPVRLERLE